jgi:HEAT repeat protein/pSer/pThr/pTyr-binding forkhead associated (FHA) protein
MSNETGPTVPLVFHVYQDGQLVRTETLNRDVVKIGSHAGSHLRIENDDGVSRIHAVIDATKGADQVELIDLDSTNGTIVNGKRINKCILQTGHEVLIGNTKLVVEIGQEGAAFEEDAPTQVATAKERAGGLAVPPPPPGAMPPPPPPPPMPPTPSGVPQLPSDEDFEVPTARKVSQQEESYDDFGGPVPEISEPAPSADGEIAFVPSDALKAELAAMNDESLAKGAEEIKSSRGVGRKLMLGLVLIVVAAGVVYLYYQQRAATAEVRALADLALDPTKQMEDETRAEALRKVLATEAVYPALRSRAAEALGKSGESENVPVLIAAITDNEEVSQAAALAIGKMNDEGHVPEDKVTEAREKVYTQLQDSSGIAKARFAFALALLHDPRCIDPLIEGFVNEEEARQMAGLDARLISQFANTQKLVDLTGNPDAAVRRLAAQALGLKQSEQGPDALIRLLSDPDKTVIQVAAGSLAKISPTRAGPELIQLLKRQPDMQGELVAALRDSVGAPGIQPIYEGTDDWELKLRLIQLVRAPPAPNREVTSDFPRGIGDPRGADMCNHFYQNYPGPQAAREMGLWCLEELGDPRAAEGLFKVAQEAFSPERDAVIDDSIKSIGYLKLPNAEATLVDMLKKGKGRPATILVALGRIGGPELGSKIEPYTHCPEADVLAGGACDRETALKVLGRLRWPNALKLFLETAERRPDDKVATRIESRDPYEEFRLRDRLAAIAGIAFLRDSGAAELMMKTLEDTTDDPEVRFDAARALAYAADDATVATILTKVRDANLDMETRKYFLTALWHHPNREVANDLINMMADANTPQPLLLAAGFAIGEAGADAVDQTRLRSLLSTTDTDHLVPACVAVLMAGDDEAIQELLNVFQRDPSIEVQVRDRYAGDDGHPVYITPALFTSGRLYQRLHNADLLWRANENAHNWAMLHIVSRLLVGTADSPDGMSPFAIRQQLANDVRNSSNPEWKRMAAVALLRMGWRGYVLMLAAEDGPGAEVARRVLIEN